MILGIGTDICAVSRIEKAMENPRFTERIFSPGEREHIAARGAQTAAGLFAAKEAVAKALGTGFQGFCPWDIEIVWDETGRPLPLLKKGALDRFRRMGGESAHLSISHDGGMAVAFAIIESR